VTFGNKKYDFLLSDPTASASSPADPNPVLYIDRKGNSKWGTKQDQYSLVAPIDLSHQTLKVDDVSFLEGSIFFSPSKAPVPEVPLPNLLEDGDVTPSFKEVTLGKKKIDFPREYRGKVVLLDFWATWCVPCMKEMPNVVQNYQKFHSTGFDVLGISLDNRETSKRIGSVARATGMDWDQICDFQLWKAQVAQLYSVTAIPQSYLIDGTTGKVLASGLELRGQGLGIALSRIFPKP
jgi:thiol-disulfide isomerase/thioredoxin